MVRSFAGSTDNQDQFCIENGYAKAGETTKMLAYPGTTYATWNGGLLGRQLALAGSFGTARTECRFVLEIFHGRS
jgi:hypothetical protein